MFQVEDMLDSFYKELVPSVQTLDALIPARATLASRAGHFMSNIQNT